MAKVKSYKVGYSYWGYLGDYKFDTYGNLASTPDGNAFYSTSIIGELLFKGFEVIQVMPDRDRHGYVKFGDLLFNSWGHGMRSTAYDCMKKNPVKMRGSAFEHSLTKKFYEDIEAYWYRFGLDEANFILHEWRFPIAGRNTSEAFCSDYIDFQPDLRIQDMLIGFCAKNNVQLVIFDLDYKMTNDDYDSLKRMAVNFKIIELGHAYENGAIDNGYHVEIPFNWNVMMSEYNDSTSHKEYDIVYVGNQYERDESFKKYFDNTRAAIYGKWFKDFGDYKRCAFFGRIHPAQIPAAYSKALATVLIAKPEYYDNSFMTARLLEAVFYGTVPFFAEEYGSDTIAKYAGDFASFLVVNDGDDLQRKVELLKKEDYSLYKSMLSYLRDHLKFMSANNFANRLLEIVS